MGRTRPLSVLAAAALGFATGACRGASALGEPTPDGLGTSAELTITLRASPTAVVPGDTVRLVAVAHNRSARRVQVGTDCGPSLDVRVTPPGGGPPASVLAAMLGPNAMHTCELGPYHFAEPRDSLALRLWWVAPAARGTYRAVAGARRHPELALPSAPVAIAVR